MKEFVYFARDPETGNVKIGHSCKVEHRVRALRGQVGHDLEIVAVVEGARPIEGRFHAMLIDLHIGGEWFRPSPRLEAVIIGVAEGWFDLSKLPSCVSPIRSASAHRTWAARRERQAQVAA
jgi:hypothetical protein